MAVMDRRLELHEELCRLLGSRHVYFQPPESVRLVYPCIIYEPNPSGSLHADNSNYIQYFRYDVTLIYTDPDSELPTDFKKRFEYSRHDRHFVSDNLYHDTFVIYY